MEVQGAPLQSVLVTAQGKGSVMAPSSDLRRVLQRWAGVARLWWRCPSERRRAWAFVAACVALSITNVGLLLWISYVQNALQTSLSEKQQAGFHAAVWDFVLIIVVAAPLFALTDYVDSCLTVAWRKWLTQHMIRAYFAGHAYFRLRIDPQAIDNPDQARHRSSGTIPFLASRRCRPRICEDVRAYTATSVMLSVSIMRKIFMCVAFAGLLWSLAPQLAVFLIFYAVGGTWVTAAGFGRRLMRLTYSVLQREADLRFALVRVRENAESIAFYSGDQREAELAVARLARVIATIFGKASFVRWEAYLSLWQNIYTYATILLPSLLLSKRYFAGEIRFGGISQASFAFHAIEGALSYIITHLSDMSQLAAQTDRLDALLAALVAQAEGAPGGVRRKGSTGGSVEVSDLTLTTPHGEQTLCKGLSLRLEAGQSLLIVGPSGVGKTSIMRAVAGLWTAGSGTIAAPADTFFLPQRPYMPLGTLREQLTFPDSYAEVAASARPASGSSGGGGSAEDGAAAAGGGIGHKRSGDGGGGDSDSGEDEGEGEGAPRAAGGARRAASLRGVAGSGYRRLSGGRRKPLPEGGAMLDSGLASPACSPALDAELQGLLEAVCLPSLLARVGGLDAELDWAHMLSLGEQQRVSVARLLHHRPAVAFLDEATSALDMATERALYTRLQQHCACFISIAHRRQLAAFHTHVLEAAGDGSWVLQEAPDFLRRLQE
ncbi:hypothetical protein CHLNCDRAFT_143667 [Chlorella variabilis]|uniref:ABC transporter domain-containing protein n=1 Tax=Chlorella variabilis TaxID=554065 RepID=E1ZA73_CHLVA|nr:hypothetical protein CHLNCDRAFT_143667 [Chlorella variabilis]EFN57216.1 hypothetical protein CHLNCDRAFT_143667 [Chlorella variabilis]|eukprot:XP_005849318.1 hypothetical protein CHLNCDRAFT_143667 [Chlorella variabilis]